MALEHVDQLAGSENFEKTIANFDHNFSKHFKDLLSRIMSLSTEAGGYGKLINLIYRSVTRAAHQPHLQVSRSSSLSPLSKISCHAEIINLFRKLVS